MNEEFDFFIRQFDFNEDSIRRKYEHSKRVQMLCEKFETDRTELASVIGLLHDYGRFHQWVKYRTFDDTKSIDHGDYAVSELFDKNKIEKFYNNKNEYKIIYEAIKYHNKYFVPADVEDKYMCNLIRDADKLDILYMYTIGELIFSEDGDVSEKIRDDFFNHKLIDSRYLESKIDRSVNVLSLIYDLKFTKSFEYLKNNMILEKLCKNISENKLKDYFEEIKKFIDINLREDD